MQKIPKLHLILRYGNCAFPKNFRDRKLGEITVFHAVYEEYSIGVFSEKKTEQEPFVGYVHCPTDGRKIFEKL